MGDQPRPPVLLSGLLEFRLLPVTGAAGLVLRPEARAHPGSSLIPAVLPWALSLRLGALVRRDSMGSLALLVAECPLLKGGTCRQGLFWRLGGVCVLGVVPITPPLGLSQRK